MDEILLYRIMHRDNLERIFQDIRLFCPNHPNRAEKYRAIGESDLIEARRLRAIPVDPNGTISDYVAFYLGPRPVMLYCIKNGFDVQAIPQEEIIYLISSYRRIEQLGKRYVFSDGHGYDLLTRWFNDSNGFKELDWKMIFERDWSIRENDTDRKRRKQAEFLVHNELELSAIRLIVVYNGDALGYVNNLLAKFPKIDYINTEIRGDFYY